MSGRISTKEWMERHKSKTLDLTSEEGAAMERQRNKMKHEADEKKFAIESQDAMLERIEAEVTKRIKEERDDAFKKARAAAKVIALQRRLRPDKIKLADFVDEIESVEVPEVLFMDSGDVLKDIKTKIAAFVKESRMAINNLNRKEAICKKT